jgi:hypothetical protein
MEQHPVPQNVTTFQFRLIGDMTLKQFGYLIGGAIGAYIMYKLPLPFFFTWPLAILSALMGVGFAFVPIEERPMDVWVLSFIKSIYSPTQYVWSRPKAEDPRREALGSKHVPQPKPEPESTRRDDILNTIFLPTSPGVLTMDTPKKGPFGWFSDLLKPKATSKAGVHQMDFSPPPVVRPAPDISENLEDTQKKESVLEEKCKKLQEELDGKNATQSRILELQTQLTELLSEREKMSQEMERLRRQGGVASVPPPKTTTTTQVSGGPTIQIIAPGRAVNVGLPRLTTFPNIVTGIIKDKEKNLLPGVLVTVKDKDGVPLRALKTNRLGQFAASTQLPNGVYFVETEDPRLRFTFDRAQITLNGTIVPALEIFAKTEKEITRAKLEKELFGTPT